MELSDLVRIYLADDAATVAAELAVRKAAQDSGVRLVRVGPGPDRQLTVHDATTNEHLFTGFPEQVLSLFRIGNLADVDSVDSTVDATETPVADVPYGLQETVRLWVESHRPAARQYTEAARGSHLAA